MHQKFNFLLKIFFSLISVFFLISFSLNIFNKNNLDQPVLTIDNEIENSNGILDEILPYCNGLKYQDYTELKYSDLDFLDVKINNRQKWYSNMFELALDNGRTIEPKYKKTFKGIVTANFKNEFKCESEAEIKISGDWTDHIDKGNFIASLDVKLLNGNLFGITKFKLFLPETRKNENEIVITSLLEEAGFISPRTFYVNVGQTGFNNTYLKSKYIFQEKASKEMLEFYKFREAPIYEVDESRMWEGVVNGTRFADGLFPLMISKSLNKYWATRGEESFKITLEGMEMFNKAIFNSYWIDSQLNYSFLGPKSEQIYMYDAASLALLIEHSMTNHNRKFVYDKLSNQFYPIYYDGNSDFVQLWHIRGRAEYVTLNEVANGAKLLLQNIDIDENQFNYKLKDRGYEVSLEESNEFIKKFKNNLLEVSTYQKEEPVEYYDFVKNSSLIRYEENFQYFFYDTESQLIEVCDKELLDCKIDDNEYSFKEILSKSLETIYGTAYFLGTSKDNFLRTDNLQKEEVINIDSFNIINFGDTQLNIDLKNKTIDILFSSSYQKVKFSGPGEIKGWTITANTPSKIEANFTQRADENLLTGCVTFYKIEFSDVKIYANNLICEDSLNIINSNGSIQLIEIINAEEDALDIDFSELNISEINIVNAGNDCLDLSYGAYFIDYLFLESCSDKSVSIGENSISFFNNLNTSNADIGIAVKDSSYAEIISANFSEVTLCLSAYRKKEEFGPSYIKIKQLVCPSNSKNFIQEGSALHVGD